MAKLATGFERRERVRLLESGMDSHHEQSEVWSALIEVDQYIARGLTEQVSSSKSFDGNDMKPVINAYKVVRQAEPFLPAELVREAYKALLVARNELNIYLEKLRNAVSASGKARENALDDLRKQNEAALSRFREATKVVNENIKKTIADEVGELVAEIQQRRAELPLPPEKESELDSALHELQEQINTSAPDKMMILGQGLKTARNVLEGIAAGTVATAIWPVITNTWLPAIRNAIEALSR